MGGGDERNDCSLLSLFKEVVPPTFSRFARCSPRPPSKDSACRNLLLCSLKHERLLAALDDKIFTVNAKVTRRNDPVGSSTTPRTCPSWDGQDRVSGRSYVLSVVSSEGDVWPVHLFQKGETGSRRKFTWRSRGEW